jgi:hypothetical protein
MDVPLLERVNRIFSTQAHLNHQASRQRADDIGRAVAILEHATDYLQQFGIGRDLEYANARYILQNRLNQVWGELSTALCPVARPN